MGEHRIVVSVMLGTFLMVNAVIKVDDADDPESASEEEDE